MNHHGAMGEIKPCFLNQIPASSMPNCCCSSPFQLARQVKIFFVANISLIWRILPEVSY